jgi:hypothetical protein
MVCRNFFPAAVEKGANMKAKTAGTRPRQKARVINAGLIIREAGNTPAETRASSATGKARGGTHSGRK